jgi:hypothetical protein
MSGGCHVADLGPVRIAAACGYARLDAYLDHAADEHWRGLHLVKALSARWGRRPQDPGPGCIRDSQ